MLPFLEYAVQGLVDGLREQLSSVRDQQWTVSWVNYVHGIFRDRKRIADRRQRDLVLDLSERSEPVPIGKLAELSPRIAKDYVSKTSRTLSRDLAEIEKLGLIERTPHGIRARREIILAFLPWRRKGPGLP